MHSIQIQSTPAAATRRDDGCACCECVCVPFEAKHILYEWYTTYMLFDSYIDVQHLRAKLKTPAVNTHTHKTQPNTHQPPPNSRSHSAHSTPLILMKYIEQLRTTDRPLATDTQRCLLRPSPTHSLDSQSPADATAAEAAHSPRDSKGIMRTQVETHAVNASSHPDVRRAGGAGKRRRGARGTRREWGRRRQRQ